MRALPWAIALAAALAAPQPASAVLEGLFPLTLPEPLGVDATLTIDAAAPGTPFPRALLGTSHHPLTSPVVAAVRQAGPPHMRIDAYFDRAAPAPGVFDWSEMDRRLGLITASGAQPYLILAYTPPWLADCPGYAGYHLEQRFCPPTDLDAWRAVVRAGAERAALRWGVRDFEVWNEPDNPGFWRGSLADYLALYEASVRGVEDAAQATGLSLRVGGPAAWWPDPAWIVPMLAHARLKGLPVDFVSFHWYADYPLFGPVFGFPGTGLTDNPALFAQTYGVFVRQVRAWADAAGFPDAEVWVDEWNVNAGDAARMRGPFGAAFVVAVVDELDEGGADRAAFFNVQHDVWGLFSAAGAPRPSWQAFRALLALGDTALPVTEQGAPWVGAVAARDADGGVRAVIANFNAQAEVGAQVRVVVQGLDAPWTAVRDLDGALLQEGPVPPGGLVLDLPDLAVRVVRFWDPG